MPPFPFAQHEGKASWRNNGDSKEKGRRAGTRRSRKPESRHSFQEQGGMRHCAVKGIGLAHVGIASGLGARDQAGRAQGPFWVAVLFAGGKIHTTVPQATLWWEGELRCTSRMLVEKAPVQSAVASLLRHQPGYSSVGRASDCRHLQQSDGPWFDSGWPDLLHAAVPEARLKSKQGVGPN